MRWHGLPVPPPPLYTDGNIQIPKYGPHKVAGVTKWEKVIYVVVCRVPMGPSSTSSTWSTTQEREKRKQAPVIFFLFFPSISLAPCSCDFHWSFLGRWPRPIIASEVRNSGQATPPGKEDRRPKRGQQETESKLGFVASTLTPQDNRRLQGLFSPTTGCTRL